MVHAVIPFRPTNPKTRLSCILSQEEREKFALAMLSDVICTTNSACCRTVLLCTEDISVEGAETVVKPLGLNEALNEYLSETDDSVFIIMSDLPLATAESVIGMVKTGSDIAVVPGRGGGTNAIFVKNPDKFHVDFYGASFSDHLNICRDEGLTVEVIDSFRLSTDIDEKEDLVEIFLHSEGESRGFLENLGVKMSVEKGRVGVHRHTHKEAS
ncbi:2-phospho-L-lactate guanylyltransferase [Methanoplanus endosymbiosus]|uniref:2-phospho-L-lactate guanylyltransferase n=1 Tax=Methanoplanus endosymbiosus TaxID=33865 RepID=A0A9E7TL91_9EURY|nr:2-phospho-L-lactate guanylyltransferase [Methanoplanus endosymbiosus]UUX93480.1 2-phospho-L-lactate guanylyltransferase [Methanoplanus endosymbiosus]